MSIKTQIRPSKIRSRTYFPKKLYTEIFDEIFIKFDKPFIAFDGTEKGSSNWV